MEAKIMATWRENSQLSEPEKAKTTKLLNKDRKIAVTEAPVIIKQTHSPRCLPEVIH